MWLPFTDGEIAEMQMGRWRDGNERVRLVEKVIHLERRLRIQEQALRALNNMGERDAVSGLIARVVELETLAETQAETIARLNTRRTA